MARSRILRLLRIAVSVVCGILCLLLIALWVRSNTRIDVLQVPFFDASVIQVRSNKGRLMLSNLRRRDGIDHSFRSFPSDEVENVNQRHRSLKLELVRTFQEKAEWSKVWHPSESVVRHLDQRIETLERQLIANQATLRVSEGAIVSSKQSFFHRIGRNSLWLGFPHWLPILVTGAFAAVLGVRKPYRFSLRTLLLATTLVAVVLGLVVAMK